MTNTQQSTELATVDENRLQQLRQESDAGKGGGAVWPNKLKVNRRPFDTNDKPLPMGKFVVNVDDTPHFLDEADVIVMEKGTQFLHFTGKGEYVGCTMIEDGFKPDYKDSLGGTRLGREPGMAFEDMSKSQKEVKFHFHVLGIVDVKDATDKEGNKIYKDVKEPMYVPCSLDFTGKKAIEKQDQLRKIKKKKEAYFDFVTHLAKPAKEGDINGVPYYSFDFTRGDDVQITPEILDSIEAVKSLVENENRRIYAKHLEAQGQGDDSITDLELPQED